MHKIVFSGKILPGYDSAKVRDKLLSMLGLGPEQAAKLFSGKSHTLKKGLSAEEAERYQQHLAKLGLGVEVEPPLKSASGVPFPTLIFDIEPEVPAQEAVPAKPADPASPVLPSPQPA